MKEEFFTIQKAGEFLGVSSSTLRRWEEKGVLVPERTVGNQRRYSLTSLLAFQKRSKFNAEANNQPQAPQPEEKPAPQASVYIPPINPITANPNASENVSTPSQAPIAVAAPTPAHIHAHTPLPASEPEPIQPAMQVPPTVSQFDEKPTNAAEAKAGFFESLQSRKHFIHARPLTFAGFLLIAVVIVISSLTPSSGVFGTNSSTAPQKNGNQPSVLSAHTKGRNLVGELVINIPALFNSKVTIKDDFVVNGESLFTENIKVDNKNVDLGTGELTASNVVYGLTAGANITITGDPQNPVISAGITGGVDSFQGQTGAVELVEGSGIGIDGLTLTNTGVISLGGQTGAVTLTAGSGIGVSGTTISNTDPGSSQNIFKTVLVDATSIVAGSNSDTLTFAAGSGIVLTPDASSKTITITSNASGTLSGLTTNGILYATSSTNASSTNAGTNGTVLKGVTGGAPVFGAVTLTADVSGVLPIGNGGTGVSGTPSNGQLLIGNGSGYTLATITAGSGVSVTNGSGTISVANTGVLSLTGTSNQVNLTGNTGAITVSLPQDIHTGATPTFASMTLTSNTNQLTLGTGNTGVITLGTLTSGRTYTLPDATGEICLSSGNCPGGGGGTIDGSGTANYLAKFTDTADIGNSLIYDTGQKIGIGTTSPVGLFSVSGGAAGSALVSLNETGDQNILTGSASGTTRFVFDRSGNLNIVGGVYQINGVNVITSTALGSNVVSSSLTSVGTLNSGSISNGFGAIDTGSDAISGGDITATGTTGFTGSGAGAGLTFSGSGNHLISASSGVLQLGATTLTGGITGNNQSITGLNGLSSSGTITFGAFTSNGGVLYTNASGQLAQVTAGTSTQVLKGGTTPSFGSVVLTTDVSGTLPVTSGGTGIDTVATGDMLYASASGLLARRSIGSAGQILTVQGGVPVWADAGGTINFWSRVNGTLVPLNVSDDLLLGGLSTDSAKFAFINNVGSGTPTASISAGSGNSTYLNATGNLGTTNAQTLTLGGTSTGNILIDSGSGLITLADAAILNSNITVGGITQLNGSFTLGDNGDTGSINTSDWDISTTGEMTGIGGIAMDGNLTQTGATTFSTGTGAVSLNGDVTVQSDNTLTIAGLTTNGGILYTNGTGGLVAQTGAGNSGQILRSNGGGAPTWVDADTVGTNYWQRALGALSPLNITDDLLLGGTGTSSARIALTGAAGGTATASVSGSLANNALYINGDGTLGTTNKQTLTLGSATTGNIVVHGLGTGIVKTNAAGVLSSSAVDLGTADVTGILTNAKGGTGDDTSGTTGVPYISTGNWQYEAQLSSARGGTGADLSGAAQGSIPYFSAAGVMSALAPGTGGYVLTTNGAGQNPSWVDASTIGSNFFDRSSGVLSPKIASVHDLLLGSNATASAKIGFININSGVPTASVSANDGGNATFLTGAGNLGTANSQSLSLGGATTGDISITPRNGSGRLSLNVGALAINGIAGVTEGTAQCVTTTNGIVTGTGVCQLGSEQWTVSSGAISTGNPSLDLLLGSNATESAKFAFTNVSGGTPTASISGTGNNRTFLTGAGNLGTTNAQTLTLGGASTGNIVLDSGSGLITLADAAVLASSVLVNGAFTFGDNGDTGSINTSDWDISTSGDMTGIGGIAFDGALTQSGSNQVTFSGNVDATSGLDVTNADLTVGGNATITTAGAITGTQLTIDGTIRLDGTTLSTLGAGNDLILDALGDDITSTDRVTIGSAVAGPGQLNILGAQAGKALTILNETGDQNILSASASGSTVFNLTRSGTLQMLESSGGLYFGTLSVGNLDENETYVLPAISGASSADICLSTGNCAGGAGGSKWQLASNVIAPLNATDRVVLGGNITSPFQLEVNGTQPGKALVSLNDTGDQNILTASASGATVFNLTRNGTLQLLESSGATYFGSLSVGNLDENETYILPAISGASSADICLSTGNCAGGAGGSKWQLASNTLAPLTATDRVVLGGNTTTNFQFEVNGRQTGKALVSLNETGNQDIFTASASGTTRLTLSNGGNLNLIGGVYQSGGVSGVTEGSPSCVTVTGGIVTGTGVCQLGSEQWTVGNGAITTGNPSLDLLLGSSSTDSAKFAFTGVSGGTPTASISAGTANNNTFLTGAGNLGTTNMQTLTLGGASTGNIVLDSGSGLISLLDATTIAAALNVTGNITQTGATTFSTGTGAVSLNGDVTVQSDNTLTVAGLTTDGGLLFTDGTGGLVAQTGAGNSGQILRSNGGGAPTWVDASTVGINYWLQNGGAVSPIEVTNDLLLGSTATSSARFAVTNIAGGTPTASLSAGVTGGLTIDASGRLLTTAMQSLTLGGSTTGNIVLDSGTGVVRLADLTTNGIVYTTNNNGTLATEAQLSSGRGGTGADLSGAAQGSIPYFSAAGVMSALAPDTAGYVLTTNGAGQNPSWTNAATLGTNYFDRANGVISPKIAGVHDLLLGSNATDSAKFAFINVNDGTPTASISGTGNNRTFLTGAGNLGTTNAQTLTLGGASTGNIVLDSGSGLVSIIDALNISGNVDATNGLDVTGANLTVGSSASISIAGAIVGTQLDIDGSLRLDGTTFSTVGAGNDLTIDAAGGNVLFADSDTLIIGGHAGNVAYNVISDNGGSPASGQVASDNDLYVQGTLEAGAIYQGANQVCDMSNNCANLTFWNQNLGALATKNTTLDLLVGGTSTSSAKFAVLNVNPGAGTPTASVSAGAAGAAYLTAAGALQTTANQTLTLGGGDTGNVVIDSGAGGISLLDATTIAGAFTQTGGAQITLSGNVDANAGLDVTGASLTVNGNATITTAGAISGTQLDIDGTLRLNGQTLSAESGDLLLSAADGDIASANRLTIGTTTPGVGQFNVVGKQAGQALAILNETGDQDILVGSASGTTRFVFDRAGNLNLNGGGLQIAGTTVVDSSRNITNAGTIDGTQLTIDSTIRLDGTTLSTLGSNDLTLDADGGNIIFGAGDTFIIGGHAGNVAYNVISDNGGSPASGQINSDDDLYVEGVIEASALYQGANQVCDTSGNCSGLSVNYWDQANGALSAKNTTVDLLLGGTSTSSARFAVTNINSGTPVASLSAGVGGFSISADGTIQTTANQALRIGGSATGEIILNAANGGISLLDTTTIAAALSQTGGGQITLSGNIDANSGLDVSGASLTVGGQATITTAGAISGTQLDIDGTLRLNGQTLSAESGDLLLSAADGDIASANRLTIGTASPGIGQFNVLGSQAGKALVVLNETGANDIFTASSAGTTRFNIANDGTITASKYGTGVARFDANGVVSSGTVDLSSSNYVANSLGITNGGTGLNSIASGQLIFGNATDNGFTKLNIGAEGSILTVQSGVPAWAAGSTINYWQRSQGAMAPLNITDDLLLGGTSTTSAKFAFINNIGSGTPTASISAGSNNSTFLTGAGNLGTTNAQTLMLGGASTGNIVLNAGSDLITLSDNTTFSQNITIAGTTGLTFSSTGSINLAGGTISDATDEVDINDDLAVSGLLQVGGTSGTTYSRFGTATADGANLGASNDLLISGALEVDDLIYADGGIDTAFTQGSVIFAGSNGVLTESNANYFWDNTNARLGLGTTSPLARLDVRGQNATTPAASISANSNFAGLVVDNSGSGDLFTASKSGATKFVINNNGNLQIFGTQSSPVTLGSLASAARSINFPDASGTICLQGSASCGFVTGTNFWQSANAGTIAPYNNTVDLLVGGTATSSAKFAVTGVAGSTTTASVSGTTGAAYLNSTGTLQTTNNQTLSLGGDSTGNIILNGDGNNRVGIGTTNPTAILEIGGTRPITFGTDGGSGTVNIKGDTGGWDMGYNFIGSSNAALGGFNAYGSANSLNYYYVGTAYDNALMTIRPNGTIGIGTGQTAPNATLDVLGTSFTSPVASFSGSTGRATMVVDQTNIGDIFTASKSGATKFVINNLGNVGINVANPTDLLSLNGKIRFTNAVEDGTDGNVKIFTGGIPESTADGGLTGSILTTLANYGNSGNGLIFQYGGTQDGGGMKLTDDGLTVWGAGDDNLFQVIDEDALATRLVIDDSGDIQVGEGNTGASTPAMLYMADYSNNAAYSNGVAQIQGNWANTGHWGIGHGTISSSDNTLRIGNSLSGHTFDTTQTLRLIIGGTAGQAALGTLDLRSVSATAPTATISANSNFAAAVVDQTGNGDLFTASKSGATKFVINNNGNIQFAGTGTALNTIAVSNSSAQTYTLPTTGGTFCMQGSASCGFVTGTNFWQSANAGTIAAFNDTVDLLVGGTATSSAKFAVTGVAGSTTTASISGTTGAAYLNSTGNLQTTNNQTLTLGGNTTGTILLADTLDAGNNDIAGVNSLTISDPGPGEGLLFNNTSANWRIDVTDLNRSNGDGNLNLHGGANNIALWRPSLWVYDATNYTTGTALSTGGLDFTTTGTGNLGLNPGGNVGIGLSGTNSLLAKLDVRGTSGTTAVASVSGNTARAAMFVDNNGVGDLFTASKSGATKFVINNAGNVGIGVANPQVKLAVKTDATSGYGWTVSDSTDTAILGSFVSSTTCSGLSGCGQIGTQSNHALQFFTNNGSAQATLQTNGSFGIGTVNPLASLDVRAHSFTSPVASFSGSTGRATMVVDQTNIGDIFTASKSGATKFTIQNNGNIQFAGTGTALNTIAVSNSSAQTYTLPTTGGTFCMQSSTSCGFATGTNFWQSANAGTIAAYNNTVDLLVGGTATSSAKFSVLGMAAGTSPTASISATSGSNAGNGITLGGDGVIQSLRNNNLFIGGNTTGDILLNSDSVNKVGVGTAQPVGKFAIGGAGGDRSGLTLENTSGTIFGQFYYENNDAFVLADRLTTSKLFLGAGNDDQILSIAGLEKNVGINTVTALATLDVRGSNATGPVASVSGNTHRAAMVVDNNGVGDLFTASSSGLTRFTIQQNGNVAIGFAEPSPNRLSVRDRSNDFTGKFQNDGTTSFTSGFTVDLPNVSGANNSIMELFSAGSSRFLVQGDGSVGIGTTSPATTLDIRGNSGTTTIASISGQTAGTGLLVDNNGLGDLFTASKSGATKFVINNAGNVGIGTSRPSYGLDVISQMNPTSGLQRIAMSTTDAEIAPTTVGSATYLKLGGQEWGANSYRLIGFGYGTPSDNAPAYMGFQEIVTSGSTYGDLVFGTRPNTSNTAATERLRITSAGAFGFNTASPLATLDVRGNNATGPVASVSGNTHRAAMVVDNNGVGDLFTASKSGATKFVITNGGTVGIGQFPRTSAGSTPTGTLHLWGLGSGGSQSVISLGDTTNLGNVYIKEAGVIDTDQLEIGGRQGIIFAAGSTGYGGEKMQLDSNGNLLINGVGSSARATLDVRANTATGPVASVSGSTHRATMFIDNSGTGDLFTASKSGATKFTILNSGDVQIANLSTAGGVLYTNGSGTIAQSAQGVSGECLKSGGAGAPTWGACDAAASVNAFTTTNGLIHNGNLTQDFAFGGMTSESAKFKISVSGTQPTASVSGLTSNAAMIVDNRGTGDIFTASSAGQSRFTIKRSGLVVIGSETNGIVFNPIFNQTNGIYYGTGRPTKQLVLSPEYMGGVLTASGSSTTDGDMTADASASGSTLITLGGNAHQYLNYYEWSSAETSLQDYTVGVRINLPADFASWAPGGSALQVVYNTELNGSGSNKLDMFLYPGNTSTPAVYRQSQVSATGKAWTTIDVSSADLIDGTGWTSASQSAMIYLKMSSRDNNHVQISDIILNYLSKF